MRIGLLAGLFSCLFACDSGGTPDACGAACQDASSVDAEFDAPLDAPEEPDLALIMDEDVDVAPDLTPRLYVSHSEWENFCLHYTSCFGTYRGGVSGLSVCTGQGAPTAVVPFSWRQTACAQNFVDCPNFITCVNGGPSQPCTGQTAYNACLDAGVSRCIVGLSHNLLSDCGGWNLSCREGTPTNYTNCSLGTCDAGVGVSCLGNIRVSCQKGSLWQVNDCSKLEQAACGQLDGGLYGCVGTGAPCTAPRCEGDTVVFCLNGNEARYDCTKQELKCITDINGNPICRKGVDCDQNSFGETCNGTVLTYCDNGKLKTIDCAAAGLGTCHPRSITDAGTLSGGC